HLPMRGSRRLDASIRRGFGPAPPPAPGAPPHEWEEGSPSHIAILRAHRDGDLFPLATLVQAKTSVAAHRDRAQLPLQLAVAIEPPSFQAAVRQRGGDRAPWLSHM